MRLLDERIRALPRIEQADFWISVIKDFELDTESRERTTLASLKLHQFDARERLEKVGDDAVAALVDLVEEYAEQDDSINVPMTIDKSWIGVIPDEIRVQAEKGTRRVTSPAFRLTDHALWALHHIGTATDRDVSRLAAVMERLVASSFGRARIGSNLTFLADTLHVLRPSLNPAIERGSSDNKLLNYRAFGVSEPTPQ